MGEYLIKNALVVAAEEEAVQDVLVRGEKIEKIGRGLTAAPEYTVIDGTGKLLLPGGVDVHTHLNLDVGIATASDDFYTGTVAAALGGTTSIVDHIGFGPPGCALSHQIEVYHGLAGGKAVIDYGFHGVIQHVDDAVLAAMKPLVDSGITSFKLYLTYGFKIDDGPALRVLERAGDLGALIAVHPENDGVLQMLRERFKAEGKVAPRYHPAMRPAACEAEAISRMIYMALMAGEAPLYIVHLTNELGLAAIITARRRGQRNLYMETCPQYLLLDESLYAKDGAQALKYVMCPPLRSPQDAGALWQGLARDIDTVATDHCPFFFATQKIAGKDDVTRCPSGAPGVEERMMLMYSEGVVKGRLTLRRFVELCSENPAKLCGLYPQKGVIKVGSDADLVLFDPSERRTLSAETLHSHVDYTAYEGFEVQGIPQMVFSRGERIVHNGIFTGAAGRGRFLKRGCCSLPQGKAL